jgi:hypothetical protein
MINAAGMGRRAATNRTAPATTVTGKTNAAADKNATLAQARLRGRGRFTSIRLRVSNPIASETMFAARWREMRLAGPGCASRGGSQK